MPIPGEDPSSRPALGALFALALLETGCATSLSLSAAPNVDHKGRLGTEERVETSVALGPERFRVYTSLAAGGGYLGALGTGYGMISPELGVEGGGGVRWSAGAFYAPRFYSLPVKVAEGGGLAGHVLFRVGHTRGDGSGIALGPRLSVEEVSAPTGRVTVFQLGFVLRWITFSATKAPLL